MITAKKQSRSKFFAAGMPCICTYYMYVHYVSTICDHYLTDVATIEIVTLLTEHEIGLRSDLLAFNFTKFLGGTQNCLYATWLDLSFNYCY